MQRAGGTGSAVAASLEEDNDRLTADLEQKVSALKFASQAIHDEVSEHNRLLSSMVRERQRPRAPARLRAHAPPRSRAGHRL
jgi:hypothetical protein